MKARGSHSMVTAHITALARTWSDRWVLGILDAFSSMPKVSPHHPVPCLWVANLSQGFPT